NNLSILPNAEMGNAAYQQRHGMVLIESRIHNVHGAFEADVDGIYETQDLVVATAAMPHADWRRARAFAWLTGLVHFDKLLQVPLIVANKVHGVGYRPLIEAFLAVDGGRF